MDYPAKSVALTFAGGKDAALYFDYIVPLTHAVFEKPELSADGSRATASVPWDAMPSPRLLRDVLPPPLSEWRNPFDIINMLQMLAGGLGPELGGTIPTLTDPRAVDIALPRAPEAFHLVPEVAVRGWLTYLSECHANGGLSYVTGVPARATEAVSSPALVLSNLNLVNTDDCPLEQILEFRKDADSQRKLRRLRTFIYSNYNGKPLAYVEDDILQRVDDYADAVKLWGFRTATGAIKYILNDKTVAALGTTALGAFLLDYKPVALGAVAVSATLVIGNLALYCIEQRHSLTGLKTSNGVGYIVDARAALER